MANYKPKPKAKGNRRSAASSHAECSKKRSILKERLAATNIQVEALETEKDLLILRMDILHDIIATVVETMGLEVVLDPFGHGLPTELPAEGKDNKPPSA